MTDWNVLALFKGAEKFIFVYDDESREELLGSIRDHAANPAFGLNWFDAAVLCERAERQAAEALAVDPPDGRA